MVPTSNLDSYTYRVSAVSRVSPEHNARDVYPAQLADYIRKTVDAAPPFTTEQRDKLALLLRGERP
jgi:hypothetical protein